jgi:hypothetical protein
VAPKLTPPSASRKAEGSSLQYGQPSGALSFPQDPQCSPGMTPSGSRSHPHGSFLLPGLPAQGRRATLPQGIRYPPRRLGLSPRVARLFLPASLEEKRARGTKLCCCSPRWLAPDTPLARFLFTSGWLLLRNLSQSAVVSQALRTNTAAGRAFFILTSGLVAAGEALP